MPPDVIAVFVCLIIFILYSCKYMTKYGFLGLLIIGMIVIAPLLSMGNLKISFDQTEKLKPELKLSADWLHFKKVQEYVSIFFCLLSILLGFYLANFKYKKTLTLTKYLLWIIYPTSLILTGIVIPSIMLSNSNIVINDNTISSLIKSIIGISIWSLYLSKSKFVNDLYIEKS